MSAGTNNLEPEAGEDKSAQDLLPLVYEELRKLAAARMANGLGNWTLQPTALVHEAWLRLVGPEQPRWKNRAHFFAAASEAMRRILIDRVRSKHASKRAGGSERIDLDQVNLASEADDDSLLAIDEALEKLAVQDAQCAELVKLRFFVGMSYDEAAEALGISPRSAKRCWTFARTWLYRELQTEKAPAEREQPGPPQSTALSADYSEHRPDPI
jgi:RNA polymerase sigma factor (TIGR02999 family)